MSIKKFVCSVVLPIILSVDAGFGGPGYLIIYACDEWDFDPDYLAQVSRFGQIKTDQGFDVKTAASWGIPTIKGFIYDEYNDPTYDLKYVCIISDDDPAIDYYVNLPNGYSDD